MAAGQSVEVLCVYEKDPEFLKFLSGLALHPGARARIRRREYDETMTLAVGKQSSPPRQARDGPHLGPRSGTLIFLAICVVSAPKHIAGQIR